MAHKKSCKFGKVSRGKRKGQCRKSKKTSKRSSSASVAAHMAASMRAGRHGGNPHADMSYGHDKQMDGLRGRRRRRSRR